ncbi:MAG: type II toxin-antitoxin system RelE/ParE family toxin [Senegalia sp. (in: firmicutes)]|uniref:type II toxin-antitoxin system RelE/ParE family toxin n=1 Tax=Senegalia sp. (in: firmicutes) TaxID=1924098 RepID=UPI003F9489A1
MKSSEINMETNKYNIKITSENLSNNETVARLMDKIENSIMRLKEFPSSCSLLEDELLRKKGYRKLIINNYIAYYLLANNKKQVIIMRVLYNKQDYQNLT